MARKTVTVLPPRVKAREQALAAGQGVTWWADWESAEPQPLDFKRAAREGVRQNAIVFACLRTLANAYAEPKVAVQDKSGKALPDHPLAQLLDQPNPHMDRARFRKFCVIYQAIGGNCYIWLERDNAGEVIGMWPMHDGQCEPVRGTGTDRDTSWVSHYLYKVGDSAYRIPASDVIQLMWFINVEDPTRGMSALAPIALALDTMRELNVYVYALLKNDATPKTIVTYKGPLTEDAIKRFKSEFADSFGGTKRGTVAVMSEADGITVNRLSANLADLAADSLRDSTEADICMQFGINPVLVGARVGIMRSIQGAPKEMRENFAETTLSPLWEEEESAFSHRLLRDNWQDDYKRGVRVKLLVEGVRALQEDADARATRFEKAWKNGGVRRKYYWDALGVTPLPDEEEDGEAYFYEVMMPKRGETPPQLQGNQPRLPGQPGAPQLPAPGQTGQEGEPPEGEPGDEVPPQLKTLAFAVAELLGLPPRGLLSPPAIKATLGSVLEDTFARALAGALGAQLARVLDDLGAQPVTETKAVTAGAMAALERLYGAGDGGWFGDGEDEANVKFTGVLRRYLEDAQDEAAGAVKGRFAEEAGDATERLDQARAEAARWAGKYSGKLIRDLNDTSRRAVRAALKAAIDGDETEDQLVARLKAIFNEKRARVIARTETTKALARGTVRAARAVGSTRFTFRASSRAEARCQALDGREYAASTAEKMIPVHPNCDCRLEPLPPSVGEGEEDA